MSVARVVLAHREPEKAARFYVHVCGFEEAGPLGPPLPAGTRGFRRGGIELRIVDASALTPTSPLGRRIGKTTGGSVRLELPLEDSERIEEWFVKAQQAGADIAEPLGEWAVGERSFTVADPGGYLVAFVQRVAAAS